MKRNEIIKELQTTSTNNELTRINNKIIQLLKMGCDIDMEINRNASGTINRGWLVETKIKNLVLGTRGVRCSRKGEADLIINGVEYEVKFSTNKSPAGRIKEVSNKPVILVTDQGQCITTIDALTLTKEKRPKAILSGVIFESIETLIEHLRSLRA